MDDGAYHLEGVAALLAYVGEESPGSAAKRYGRTRLIGVTSAYRRVLGRFHVGSPQRFAA